VLVHNVGTFAFAGLLLAASICTARLWALGNRVVLENCSGRQIIELEVAMRYVRVAPRNDLPDGDEGSAPFRFVGDNSFDLNETLEDGTRMGSNFGYFSTGSCGENPRFIVRTGGQIDFTQ
jgi:hypothetical protein